MSNKAAWKKSVGQRIRRSRIAAGLTQSDLTWKTKIPQSYISLVETGKRTLSIERAKKLAKALGIEASWLLGL